MFGIRHTTKKPRWLVGAVSAMLLMAGALAAPGLGGVADARSSGGGGGGQAGMGSHSGPRGGSHGGSSSNRGQTAMSGRNMNSGGLRQSGSNPAITHGRTVGPTTVAPMRASPSISLRSGGSQGTVRPSQGTVRPSQGTVRPSQGTVRPSTGPSPSHTQPRVVSGPGPTPALSANHGGLPISGGINGGVKVSDLSGPRLIKGNAGGSVGMGNVGHDRDFGRFDRDGGRSGGHDRDFGRFDRDRGFGRFDCHRDFDDFVCFFRDRNFGRVGCDNFSLFHGRGFFRFREPTVFVFAPSPFLDTFTFGPWWGSDVCWWRDHVCPGAGVTIVLWF